MSTRANVIMNCPAWAGRTTETPILVFDTETDLIRPGRPFGRLVCVSYAWIATDGKEGAAGVLEAGEGFRLVFDHLRAGGIVVGHNVFYDLWVLCRYASELGCGQEFIETVFDVVGRGQIRDTLIREQLHDIARGWFRRRKFPDGYVESRNYQLADLARRRLRIQLEKDVYQLRYAEMIGLLISEWVEGARRYPLLDATVTRGVFLSQMRDERLDAPWREIGDERNQMRKACWHTLMSGYGIRTTAADVRGLEAHMLAQMQVIGAGLQSAGLLRADGTRDTKAAVRRMRAACEAEGIPVPRTKTYQKKIKEKIAVDEADGVCLDEDACNDTSDPVLHDYATYSKIKNVISKDIPMLLAGETHPIHARFALVETGRLGCSSPNLMNLKSGVDVACSCRWVDVGDLELCPRCKGKKKISLLGDWGIRECFAPRPDHVFIQADYPGLELRTLAQFCVSMFGRSALADAINSGIDVHLKLAGELCRVSYAVAAELYARSDSKIGAARKLAKIANFGLPGGMADPAFISWAAAAGFVISPARAAELRRAWLTAWPEMIQYFAYMRKLVGKRGGPGAAFVHLFTERRRAGVHYTAACNSPFQGLGADATGHAGFLISRAMYCERLSPLFGSRLVNYVHDEFIGEAHVDRYEQAAFAMVDLMKRGANVYLPDVPFTEIEPVAMARWSKDAKSIIKNGSLEVWGV